MSQQARVKVKNSDSMISMDSNVSLNKLANILLLNQTETTL